MKEFKVEIIEILSKFVTVNAISEEEAIEKVKHLYDNEKIVLNNDNFITKEIKVSNYK